MNRIVIDLEMCRINQTYYKKTYRYRTEIIQIGAVSLDENYQIKDQFSTFVQPRFGKIDGFIKNLTGIRENQIKQAPDLKDALKQFREWIGADDYEIYAWSESDHSQIRKELESKEISDAGIDEMMELSHWIDYQQTFQNRFRMHNAPSLKNALELSEIEHQGKLHDGLDDAYNTARLIAKLETNPEYQLAEPYQTAKQEPEELTFSLGNIFAGLLLETA